MVYSILTLSREYSKAIHWTPLLSCRTTKGVVAGMGPGAALGLTVPLPVEPELPLAGLPEVAGEALWLLMFVLASCCGLGEGLAIECC